MRNTSNTLIIKRIKVNCKVLMVYQCTTTTHERQDQVQLIISVKFIKEFIHCDVKYYKTFTLANSKFCCKCQNFWRTW